jgi:subtilisin family serine protease
VPLAVLRLVVTLAAAAGVVALAQSVAERHADEPRASAYVVLEPYRPVQLSRARSGARVATPTRRIARTKVASTTAAVVPDDPLWPVSWSLAKVGAPGAWSVTTGSPHVVVAVLDTGIDALHPDLAGAVLPGWDAVNEDADAGDDHGHGTAVAGVIAARSDNGIGVTGACWRCSVMPVKVIAADGTGSAEDIAEGIRWAADHGADVVNLSFVMSGYDGAVAGAIDHARAVGALVVAAAGNTGGAGQTFPASHPGVVSVTATDAADLRYDWATHGTWTSVAAPGCSQSIFPGGVYGEFCGTSSATALVSGLAALVTSVGAGVGADVVFSTLAVGAVRVGDFVSSGRVDVAASVRRSWNGRPVPSEPPSALSGLD